MLTNNFKNFVKGLLQEDTSGSMEFYNFKAISGDIVEKFVLGYGSDRTLDGYFGKDSFEALITKSSCSIFVGTGLREESPEDIALESMIPDSDLTEISAEVTLIENTFYFKKTFTYTGISDATINEVALYKTVSPTSRSRFTFCLARQLIEPLTVKTGDTFTVTMVIG